MKQHQQYQEVGILPLNPGESEQVHGERDGELAPTGQNTL
jgi:hypothetical protein